MINTHFPDKGPAPSTWVFNSDGRLVNIPGILDITFDGDHNLTDMKLHEQGVANDGSGDIIKIETVYTLTPASAQGKFDLHEISTRERNGEFVVIFDQLRRDICDFKAEPYFIHLNDAGRKVNLATEAALKADPSTLLAGVRIKARGMQPETAKPFFLGGHYRKSINF